MNRGTIKVRTIRLSLGFKKAKANATKNKRQIYPYHFCCAQVLKKTLNIRLYIIIIAMNPSNPYRPRLSSIKEWPPTVALLLPHRGLLKKALIERL